MVNIFIEPQRGGTSEPINSDACAESAAPTELLILLFAVYPGFHSGLCPHYTLGYAGVSCLKALVISLNFDAGSLNAREIVLCNSLKRDCPKVSKRTSFTCSLVGLCRMR